MRPRLTDCQRRTLAMQAVNGRNTMSLRLRSLNPFDRPRVPAADFAPFAMLQREIARLFDDFSRDLPAFKSTGLTPKMDVTETGQEIEITAELPGLEEKDVEINVADNVLTIRGEKKAETEQKDKNYHVLERSYGAFSRSVQLPDGVDAEAIKAVISSGVLKVTIPKPAPAIAKKIDIKPAT
jgi:HSP20 family protein